MTLQQAIIAFLRISNSYQARRTPRSPFCPQGAQTFPRLICITPEHPVCSGWLWLMSHAELSLAVPARGSHRTQTGDSWASWPHKIPLRDVCACRQRVAPVKQAQSEPLGMGKPARIQEPQKNAGLPPALRRGEHAFRCSLCVKVVRRYLNIFLPWEVVLGGCSLTAQ